MLEYPYYSLSWATHGSSVLLGKKPPS